jgi:hypothetical protein
MASANIAVGFSNILVGILIILISIPLVLRKVPMNKLYGVRFKKSFESDENWYKINAYGGKQLILWSVPLVLFGVATFFLPLEGKQSWITLVGCAPLILLVPVAMSYVYAKRL